MTRIQYGFIGNNSDHLTLDFSRVIYTGHTPTHYQTTITTVEKLDSPPDNLILKYVKEIKCEKDVEYLFEITDPTKVTIHQPTLKSFFKEILVDLCKLFNTFYKIRDKLN